MQRRQFVIGCGGFSIVKPSFIAFYDCGLVAAMNGVALRFDQQTSLAAQPKSMSCPRAIFGARLHRDHTLAVTTATAKEAFAKAVEWHATERFADVSIYDGVKLYSIKEISSVMALREIANTVEAAAAELGPKAKLK